MQRAETIDRLATERLDLAVIGGGIVGARVALEGARLGMHVGLIDSGDFGGATSSASSKLVHGGFRYLPMGDIALVRQSQRERRVLMELVAPNLVRPIPFLLPVYDDSPKRPATVVAGLMLYRALAGMGGRVGVVTPQNAVHLVPGLRTDGLRMCGLFEEAETIDSRFVLATVKGASRAGALVLNHARAVALELRHNRGGTITIDAGRDGRLEVRANHVINAAGPWVDTVRRLDDPSADDLVRLSKGVHVLLPPSGNWRAGIAVPLDGGRVTMGIPWQGTLMLGTTDTLYTGDPTDARVTEDDVSEVLEEASRFLPRELLDSRRMRFAMAGLRALPYAERDTAATRRGHMIEVSRNGLVSVAGGKLTTHRLIACDALRKALPQSAEITPDSRRLPGTGWSLQVEACPSLEPDVADHLERLYGDEACRILELAKTVPDGLDRIHPEGPDLWAQVDYAFESEWACNVDDVARRRTTLAVRGLLTPAIADGIEGRSRSHVTGARLRRLSGRATHSAPQI
ncbi:MAG TPA: glycerol-3-phosphate dehydrogenase/oxidase [Candidatus Dormibacteraeota bacterium]|nr:glycerol-3-phosphate dehydrogenase/oxidase [Candidatus Dormibacteraeota bacterium]